MRAKQVTLTFNKSERVTIDGNLVTSIPDGYKYAKDGYGGNANWLYIVPEDYPLESDHIEAKPLTFGIVPIPFHSEPKSFCVSDLDACKLFLLQNNLLQQGVGISECICSEHCFFVYQKWQDSNDNVFNKINGVLFAGNKLYQFHTFMNHDEPISDDEDVIRAFELVSRQWMKHIVLTSESVYKEKGDPDEVKATLDDLSRMFEMAKERILPTIPDDLGSGLREIYALIAAMFYSKNGKRLDSSGVHSIRGMVEEAGTEAITEDDLKKLLEKSNAKTPTDIILGYKHERVLKTLITLDKLSGADVEGGLAFVHFTGVKLLLKTLCAETGLDYDLNAFSLECLESLRTVFGKRWWDTDAYTMNDSTVVVRQSDRATSNSVPQKKAKKKAASSKASGAAKTDAQSKPDASKQKQESNDQWSFTVETVPNNRKKLIDNQSGYPIRFMLYSSLRKDWKHKREQFKYYCSKNAKEEIEKILALQEIAEKYTNAYTDEEADDLRCGRLKNSAPIHALRSFVWTAVESEGDKKKDVFPANAPEKFWLELAGFIQHCGFANYASVSKRVKRFGAVLLKKEEVRSIYMDGFAAQFNGDEDNAGWLYKDEELGKTMTNASMSSLFQLVDILHTMTPIMDLFFEYLQREETEEQVKDGVMQILKGWIVFAFACQQPFYIMPGELCKDIPENKDEQDTDWLSTPTLNEYEGGKYIACGTELVEISDAESLIKIPEGITGILLSEDTHEHLSRRMSKASKIVYPHSFNSEIIVPNNVTEIEILGDLDYLKLTPLVDRETKLKRLIFRGVAREVGEKAFFGIESLKELELPEGLIKVDREAFQSQMMHEATYYMGDDSVEVREKACREGGLKTITLPESIQEISDNVFSFYNCPDALTVIAYQSCPVLGSIKEQIEEYKSFVKDHPTYGLKCNINLEVRKSPWEEKASVFTEALSRLYGFSAGDDKNIEEQIRTAFTEAVVSPETLMKCRDNLKKEAEKKGLVLLVNLLQSRESEQEIFDALPKKLAADIITKREQRAAEEKERQYAEAILLSQKDSLADLEKAASLLERFGDYKDASGVMEKVLADIKARKEKNYNEALAAFEENTKSSIQIAIERLKEIQPYKDAGQKIQQFEKALSVETLYQTAIDEFTKNTDPGKLLRARNILQNLTQYKEGAQMLAACEQKHTVEIEKWYSSIKEGEKAYTTDSISAALVEYNRITHADYNQKRILAINERCELLQKYKLVLEEEAELQSKIAAATGFFNRKTRKGLEQELSLKLQEKTNLKDELQNRNDMEI